MIDALTDPFIMRGPAKFISSEKNAAFIARKMRGRIVAEDCKTALIQPGSPRENGYGENYVRRRARPAAIVP